MEKIKVACATHSMSGYYEKYFPGLRVFGHEDNVDHADLLILTGGPDIDPSFYNTSPAGAVGCDMERDTRELNIIRKALKINPDLKILGVCRGLQMLNVFTGGDLIQDLGSIDKSHSGVHKLEFTDSGHPLSYMDIVNSLHHQAVRRFGYSDIRSSVIAVEPKTGIVEIVGWENDYLGVQFHPELFAYDAGSKFFSIITDWVKGNVSMLVASDEDEEFDEEEEDTGEEEENMDAEELTNASWPSIEAQAIHRLHVPTEEDLVRVRELIASIRTNRTQTGGTE